MHELAIVPIAALASFIPVAATQVGWEISLVAERVDLLTMLTREVSDEVSHERERDTTRVVEVKAIEGEPGTRFAADHTVHVALGVVPGKLGLCFCLLGSVHRLANYSTSRAHVERTLLAHVVCSATSRSIELAGGAGVLAKRGVLAERVPMKALTVRLALRPHLQWVAPHR